LFVGIFSIRALCGSIHKVAGGGNHSGRTTVPGAVLSKQDIRPQKPGQISLTVAFLLVSLKDYPALWIFDGVSNEEFYSR
jgi:hypothetical protein